jgi:hypothetical protein
VISEVQRLQYLEAMGIKAWISRERASVRASQGLEDGHFEKPRHEQKSTAAPDLASQNPGTVAAAGPASFVIGPGSGQTLLLCGRREDAALPVSSDIARCLDEAPVWGWLSQPGAGPGAEATGLSLERAINERLFTRVLMFSSDFAAGEQGNDEVKGSARIIHAPPLAELANQPAHKRRLWQQLTANGWCSSKG